jgi:hypothetical protein
MFRKERATATPRTYGTALVLDPGPVDGPQERRCLRSDRGAVADSSGVGLPLPARATMIWVLAGYPVG